MPDPLPQVFFKEMKRLIDECVHSFRDECASQAGRANWLGPAHSDLLQRPVRDSMEAMLRSRLADLCLGVASALDGATAMSASGQPVYLCDRTGKRIPSDLMSGMTTYFDEHLWTS